MERLAHHKIGMRPESWEALPTHITPNRFSEAMRLLFGPIGDHVATLSCEDGTVTAEFFCYDEDARPQYHRERPARINIGIPICEEDEL